MTIVDKHIGAFGVLFILVKIPHRLVSCWLALLIEKLLSLERIEIVSVALRLGTNPDAEDLV